MTQQNTAQPRDKYTEREFKMEVSMRNLVDRIKDLTIENSMQAADVEVLRRKLSEAHSTIAAMQQKLNGLEAKEPSKEPEKDPTERVEIIDIPKPAAEPEASARKRKVKK